MTRDRGPRRPLLAFLLAAFVLAAALAAAAQTSASPPSAPAAGQPPSSPSPAPLPGAAPAPAPPPIPPAAPLVDRDAAVFHHLHLVTSGSAGLADFYISLFPAAAIVRGVFWETQGVRGDDAFILVSDVASPRKYGVPSAIWHFGWGKVSVGETYAEHYLNEVNWKPPYPGLTSDLHVHLTSRDPRAAAAWYETVLGAKREGESTASETPIEGRAEAIVRVGKLRLVIHQTEKTIGPSRSTGTVDHLSFAVSDVKAIATRARDAGIRVLAPGYVLPDVSTVTIEGPDLIALELVDLKGPRFLRDGR